MVNILTDISFHGGKAIDIDTTEKRLLIHHWVKLCLSNYGVSVKQKHNYAVAKTQGVFE